MRGYKLGFLISLSAALALAGALGFMLAHPASRSPMMAAPTAAAANAGSPAAIPSAEAAEPKLAPIELTPQRMQAIGVKTGIVERKQVNDEIRTTGNVDLDETRLSYVQVRFPGWIQNVYANATYQFVRKGQPLFTIYSPELVTTEQEYLLARQNRNLLAASTVPGVASGAESLLNSAAERLKQWEVPQREIAKLEETGEVRRELEIDSPVTGFITERNALPNMYVQPGTKLYTVADLSTVWVYAQVFQNDLALIRPSDPASITVDAYPGKSFPGRVNFIWPQVDEATRTVKVRLEIPNPGLKLSLGMFVNVRLAVPLGQQLVIPASGVFQTGLRQIAFVDHGNGYFEPKDIELGARAGDDFIVLRGPKAGERIVTSANFLIDSESQLQAALGSFAPPPPGAGAAAAMNAPAAQASIRFSSVPATPHKGSNVFRVKLTGTDGKPITGAQVTVTFFMPAMPAMGMAAMRTVVNLTDKGAGTYEGNGQLQSGGTWQVTVVATKGGQTLGQNQFNITAEGGM
jgi:Cu(I)/Ag(I) efflux system membrane fusion protein/cobalt-zinc-cadmium efflux system membrane fusion protein